MKHSIRIACALLALLTITPAIVSCGTSTDNGPATNAGTNAVTDTQPVTEDPNAIHDNLPELNFNGETVSIMHFGLETMGGNDSSDWDRVAGDVVADAVVTRDRATEERLNVTIAYEAGSDDWGTYPGEVQKMIQSGDCPYDIFFLESSQCFRLSLDGYFREVSNLAHIDLTQPWWYRDFMDGGSISTDKRYFLTGAFSISTLEGASCTIFNKKIYNNYFESYTELYDMVDEHKWTYDKFIELCRDVYQDVNGNGEADSGDLYGLFNRGQQTVNYVSMSTGLTYLQRDDNGLPVLDLYNDDSIRWVEKLYTILKEHNISYTDKDIDGIAHFADGNALFFLGWLSEYTDEVIRGMEDPYGVLPMPVLDEGMEYMSAAGTVNGQSAVIPVTTDEARLELCGATLESLSIEAYRTVIPAWYEVALKSKHADTERDADMIDVIYNTIDTSFIMIADKLLGTGSFFWSMLGASKKTPGEFASYYEKQAKTFDKKWASMLEAFAELES
ncbi:MAG: extracellular solute-binding protein [Ruminococcaceae bacterium]|nr:extracellular solute-binding protein [Oscillospiraceae bacterium]